MARLVLIFRSEHRFRIFFSWNQSLMFNSYAFAVSDLHRQKYAYHVLRSKNLAVASLRKGKTGSKWLYCDNNFHSGFRIDGHQHNISTFSFQKAVMRIVRVITSHTIVTKQRWVSSWFLVNSLNRRKRQEKLKKLNENFSPTFLSDIYGRWDPVHLKKLWKSCALRAVWMTSVKTCGRNHINIIN